MKQKILWIGDGVTPTGFATVNHNIIKHLSKVKYEVHHLAVNYWGDPHEYDHFVYPASLPQHFQKGDVMGFGRIKEFVDKDIDVIFLLNDIWVIDRYLDVIKKEWEDAKKDLPKIVVYFPVDGGGYSASWFEHFDIVTRTVVYTKFGYNTVREVMPDMDIEIIPHGAGNKDAFFPTEGGKRKAKIELLPHKPEMWDDSFIVLNANRNQPRKRLDVSLLGFTMFAQDKPDNVMYYHHAGIKDAGWQIVELVRRIEIELKTDLQKRIILTNTEMGTQKVPMSVLNLAYNASDVGLNTSLGEGWGLTSTEHALVGRPQVVGDHSACKDLFEDIGLLIPVVHETRDPAHLTKRYHVSAEGVADKLNLLYEDESLYKTLSEQSRAKFLTPYYDWETIGKKWETLFEELWKD